MVFHPTCFQSVLQCDLQNRPDAYQARHNTDERADEPAYATLEHTRTELDKRMASDRLRYQTYYGINYQDPTHYDLVIDTTTMKGPEETAEAILQALPDDV